MTIREAMKKARLSYRDLGRKLKLAPSTLYRLMNFGEYPVRLGEEEVKRRVRELFEGTAVNAERIEFPKRGIRPGRSGRQLEKVLGTVEHHDKRSTEEIDLMQIDRSVLSLFRLTTNPFLNDVEADDDVYRSPSYELVETAIRDSIEQRGFLAIVGESGSGKTTIWDGVEAEYGRREDTVICRPQVKAREALNPEHLARCLIFGLLGDGVKIRNNSEDRGRQLSNALRAARNGQGDRKAVLLLDDAHFCNGSVLRQLKTFFEEKIGRFRLLTIILIGLPSLKSKLAEFPEIGNRIRLVEVPPVPVKEYLEFKLKRVGSSLDKLFAADGLQAFLERFKEPRRGAMGRPLVINAACIRAMVMLHQNGGQVGEKITREIVDRLPEGSSSRRAAA